LGRRKAALVAAAEALRIRRPLAEAQPDAFIPHLAESLSRVGSLLSTLDEHQAGLALVEEAVRLNRALAEKQSDAFAPDFAGSLVNLANVLSALDRRKEAVAAAGEAVHLYRALAEMRPDAFTLDYGRSLCVAGNLYAETGDYDQAMATLRNALAALTPAFYALPHAFGEVIAWTCRSYISLCETIGCELDTELLAPIAAMLAEITPGGAK
jgi:tetratricopeptide (TPR) repeat protein